MCHARDSTSRDGRVRVPTRLLGQRHRVRPRPGPSPPGRRLLMLNRFAPASTSPRRLSVNGSTSKEYWGEGSAPAKALNTSFSGSKNRSLDSDRSTSIYRDNVVYLISKFVLCLLICRYIHSPVLFAQINHLRILILSSVGWTFPLIKSSDRLDQFNFRSILLAWTIFLVLFPSLSLTCTLTKTHTCLSKDRIKNTLSNMKSPHHSGINSRSVIKQSPLLSL